MHTYQYMCWKASTLDRSIYVRRILYMTEVELKVIIMIKDGILYLATKRQYGDTGIAIWCNHRLSHYNMYFVPGIEVL